VPVDAYGVGSSLFGGRFDFTADIVMVDGKNVAKQGRGYRENSRLERVD
jgi:nicotinate phosphoribosyltransferase